MKGAGCLFTVFLLFLALGLGGLYVLRQVRPASFTPDPHLPPKIIPEPEPQPGPKPEPPPTPDPDRYKEWVDSLNEFEKKEMPDSYLLSYGFIDHSGVTHHITCSISKPDHERESAFYGYVESEVDREIDHRLQAILNRELGKRELAEYIKVKSSGGGSYNMESHVPAGIDTETYSSAVQRIREFSAYLENDYPAVMDQVIADVYSHRGFLYANNLITIDHGALAVRNQLPLADCFGALRRSARGYNEKQYLGLYVAFFQEIRYEPPPKIMNGKNIVGLYVPTEVLINDHGDCDSKSVAFSAMMRSMMKAVLVVDLPNHVMVAVETRPGPGQAFVRLGNRYFVLCEVAGPGKRAPGEENDRHVVSGYFKYTLIEPISSDLLHGTSRDVS